MAEIIIDGNEVKKETKKPSGKKSNKNKVVEQPVEETVEEVEVVENTVEEEPKGTVEKLMQKQAEPQVFVEKDETPKPKPVTMVKVKLKSNHKCNIGGDWYVFHEGKQYNVPENVKAILAKADKLLPL